MPKLLDLFCGAGGAAMGYQQAGFDVYGVDIVDQPGYPFRFCQADAMDFPLEGFDAIHASPPCHDHSSQSKGVKNDSGWMLHAILERLAFHGTPWVVENVVGPSVTMNGWWLTLCGSSFDLGVRRHRRFGSNVLMLAPGCRHDLQPYPIDVTGQGGGPNQTRPRNRKPINIAHAQEVMGIDWMNRKELTQAIPPAYTEWIGTQLMASMKVAL